MAYVGKILGEVTKFVTNGTDEVEEVTVQALVPFEPPVCGVCHDHMKNVNTVEGKRRYQCMTWGCTNRRMYDQEGNQIGQSSGH